MPNPNAVTPVSLADLPDDHPVFRNGQNEMLIRRRDIIRARHAQGLPEHPERPAKPEKDK